MTTTATITIFISLTALIVSVVFGIINAAHTSGGDVRQQIEQAKKEAATSAKIETALNGIQSDTREIKSDQKGVQNTINSMNNRLIVVEQSTKSAHHRIDRIEGKEKEQDERLEEMGGGRNSKSG